jgi:hypothetical protein
MKMQLNTTNRTLVIPEKADPERDAVAAAWEAGGGTVVRLGRFWDPPDLDPATTSVYGNDSFCLVLEQKLGLALCSPADDLLITVAPRFLRRDVVKTTVGAVASLSFPLFLKSLVPKQIRSRVYNAPSEVKAECAGLDATTVLLVSDVVDIVAEARCFVLDHVILDCALYEGRANPEAARALAATVAAGADMPRAVVIDVGALPDGDWIVIEFNAVWGSGLNGCHPGLVLPAIQAATGPRGVIHGRAVSG